MRQRYVKYELLGRKNNGALMHWGCCYETMKKKRVHIVVCLVLQTRKTISLKEE